MATPSDELARARTTTATDVATDASALTTPEVLPGTEPTLGTVSNELVPYDEVDPAERARIDGLMSEIDLSDSNSIIFFGSKAQQELTTISDSMLEGVKNKDLGSAGNSLNEIGRAHV